MAWKEEMIGIKIYLHLSLLLQATTLLEGDSSDLNFLS